MNTEAPNSLMSEEAVIRLENLKRLKLGAIELKARLGRGPSFWSDLLRGKKSFGEKLARDLEEGLQLPRGWLDAVGAELPASTNVERQAHNVSLPTLRMVPTIAWGDLMTLWVRGELPQKFEAAAPDDSMIGKVRKGQNVTFQSVQGGIEPNGGDGVLIADAAGNCYIRIFKPRTPGHWEAHATPQSGYLPLDSIKDGLQVLAVVVSVEARWSEQG